MRGGRTIDQVNELAPSSAGGAVDARVGRWPRWLGNGLIVMTVLLVIGASIRLSFTAYEAGEAMGSLLGGLLILLLLEWVLTRKRSQRTQDWNRLALGVLLFFVVANSLGNLAQQQQKAIKVFLQGVLELQRKNDLRVADFNTRLSQVENRNFVNPEVLSTPARHAGARAALAQFRALIDERSRLNESNFAEAEQYLRTQAPEGPVRDSALRSFLPKKAANLEMVAKLKAADEALADAYSDILDWAVSQAGKVGLRNGKLQLADASQQAVLAALGRRAEEAQLRGTQLEKEARVFDAEQRGTADKHKQKVLDILPK